MDASAVMAAAIVAATELIRISRCSTCPSSCATTPSISRSSISCRMPVVKATEACAGLRPVANALGESSGDHPELRHGQSHALREIRARSAPPAGRSPGSPFGDRLRRITRQRDLVGEKVSGEVHHHGQREPDVDAIAPAQRLATHDEQDPLIRPSSSNGLDEYWRRAWSLLYCVTVSATRRVKLAMRAFPRCLPPPPCRPRRSRR